MRRFASPFPFPVPAAVVAVVVGAVVALGGCGGDDDPGGPSTTLAEGAVGVAQLLEDPPSGPVAVQGNIFADTETGALLLCEDVAAADVPDVPPTECVGDRIEVRAVGIDLSALDLMWQSADGTDEYSRVVVLDGTWDGSALIVTSVSVRGEVVDEPRSTTTA